MKTIVLFLASLLFSVSAYAATPKVVGHIVFDRADGLALVNFFDQSAGCPLNHNDAMLTDPEAHIFHGCWSLKNNDVIVNWDDGDVTTYHIADIVMGELTKEELVATK